MELEQGRGAGGVRVVGVAGAGATTAAVARDTLRAGLGLRLYAGSGKDGRRVIEDAIAGLGDEGRDAAALARAGAEIDVLDDAAVVVVAASDDLAATRELLARLGEGLPAVVLAVHTSTLSVSAAALGAPNPERVVGARFSRPVEETALVEVVRGDATAEGALARAEELARALGRRVVRVADLPGGVVDRLNRPFFGEALRLLGEGEADAALVDRALREAGGFGRGPLELLDAAGLDDDLAVGEALYAASYGEPRLRPHPLQRRMVDAGRLGRKSGRGFYEYPTEGGA